MNLQRVLLVAGTAFCVGATPAASAEWSGTYAGLFGGYGWADAKATAPYDSSTGFFYNFGGAPYTFDADGFFAGAMAGYNRQSGAFVTGVEAELGYLGLRGSGLDPNGLPEFNDTTTSLDSDLYGALYARLGYAAGDILLYVKGGGAFLNASVATIDPCIAPPSGCGTETLRMTGEKTVFGWSLGTGAEWLLAPNWSVKAEYAYFDFGKIGVSGRSNVGDFYAQNVRARAHTAKFGLNYRFASE